MTWKQLLYTETRKDYYQSLLHRIREDREKGIEIYPAQEDVFNAFRLTPPDKVQVIILGQDPYHGENQAHGLAFSVRKGNKIPPSLWNIYREIRSDIDRGFSPQHGELTEWAKQGVLLLNTILTVKRSNPLSYAKIGWERFTDAVISKIDDYKKDTCVFLLWGAKADQKSDLIKHGMVLRSAHPSPYSAHAFMGCGHFSKANKYLLRRGRPGIHWTRL